ncbi:MAG: GTPase HflX, partial [Roseicyclus sp.]
DVAAILADLGVSDSAPMLEVWNKMDLLSGDAGAALATIAARRDDVFAVSAVTGQGMGPLLAAVAETLSPPRHLSEVSLPHSEGRKRAWLYDQGIVEAEDVREDTAVLTVHWTDRQAQAFKRL